MQAAYETLTSGAIIAGAFRLEQVLGEGGMGVVWAAREIATGRPVALKFLKEDREGDPTNVQRFFREARAAMGISHPNVARVEAVLQTPAGVPFMVMELLEGESLRGLLARRGPLPAPECARLAVQVVDAVAAAHANGIIHRDLKPENIFIVGQTHVRVLDFGIAKRIVVDGGQAPTASLTATGTLLGTPLYMAPEQIFGDVIDTRTDVWALGIILYECLAGRRPTDAEGFGQIIKRITTGNFQPLEQARGGLPGRVPRIVGRMLARRKDDRPSLAEIRDVLGSVAVMGDELVPSARDPVLYAPTLDARTPEGFARGPSGTTTPRGAPSSSNSTALVLAIIGAVILILAVGSVGAWQLLKPPSGPVASGNVGLLMTQASIAMGKRDGAGCLRALDQADAATAPPALPSTNPNATSALTRATCTALAGDCETAKKLYQPAFKIGAAKYNPSGDQAFVDAATDQFAAGFCEGDKLSPRDELLRTDTLLVTAAAGARKVTPAECRAWRATEERLLPKVKVRPGETLSFAGQQLGDHTATCLAHAGACDEAFRMFREDYQKKTPPFPGQDPKAYDQGLHLVWDSRTNGTSCKGKP